jgi:hypothetical protein
MEIRKRKRIRVSSLKCYASFAKPQLIGLSALFRRGPRWSAFTASSPASVPAGGWKTTFVQNQARSQFR